jgi:hypothetical protein
MARIRLILWGSAPAPRVEGDPVEGLADPCPATSCVAEDAAVEPVAKARVQGPRFLMVARLSRTQADRRKGGTMADNDTLFVLSPTYDTTE